MGSIGVSTYCCTERLRAMFMESLLIESPSRAVFEEVLGSVGAAVDLRDVLDCLIFDF